jgi:hypothetical protein
MQVRKLKGVYPLKVSLPLKNVTYYTNPKIENHI